MMELQWDIEKFKQGNVGMYLLARASSEAAEATQQLKSVNPLMFWRVSRLQNDIWRAESIEDWLEEALNEGRAAQQQFLDEDGA